MLPSEGCERACCRYLKLNMPAESLDRALLPHEKEKIVDQKPSVEESFKLFRTRLIALYVFSNTN